MPPLKRGTWLLGVRIFFIQIRFLSIIFSKNSGTYCCASLIHSLQSIRYFEKKIKSLGFLVSGKPS